MTAIQVAITMADVEAMPKGPRRDELAYTLQSRIRTASKVTSICVAVGAHVRRLAELERVRAVLTYGDTAAQQGARLQAIADDIQFRKGRIA